MLPTCWELKDHYVFLGIAVELSDLSVKDVVQNQLFGKCNSHVIATGMERTAAKWLMLTLCFWEALDKVTAACDVVPQSQGLVSHWASQ